MALGYAKARFDELPGLVLADVDAFAQALGIADFADAEIPGEGIAVRRLPSVTRRADGTYERWLTRRISVGCGEGASQLYFDAARSRRPRPNAD